MVHVKQEPSLLPGFDPPPSFGQEARTASRRQPQFRAASHSMTQRLHMGPQVKVWREEEGQATLLEDKWTLKKLENEKKKSFYHDKLTSSYLCL